MAAVNNDGDLAIDIAEDEEMETLLQEEMDKKGNSKYTYDIVCSFFARYHYAFHISCQCFFRCCLGNV